MRAAVWDQPGELRITDVAEPEPRSGEVLVDVAACGLCGTDLHIADGDFPPTPYPIVAGHEFSGRIVDVGPDVADDWSPGQRVAVDPSLFCGRCDACRAGRGNLCASWGAIGDTVDGGFAQRVAVPAANAHRLPDHVSDQEGALVEPLSCAIHGARRLGPVLGEEVLIMGAGTMGLLLAQLVGASGARSVVVVDKATSRHEAARAVGATHVTADVGSLDGHRFGVAVDATGAPAAIEAAFAALDRGGRLMVFGVASREATMSLSPFRIYNDEITVVGSMAVLNSFAAAVDLMAAGTVKTAPLLSPPLPLDRLGAGLDGVRRGQGIKTQVAPNV